MPNPLELQLKAETLERYGLPDIPYPVPTAQVLSVLDNDGELPFAFMLHGLQQRAGEGGRHWKDLEPAMDRLAELLTPEGVAEICSVESDGWWLEVGPVDINAELVTVQRDNELVAAINPRQDGRLRVAAFRPLDCDSLQNLTELGLHPHPEGGVCHRENNWQYALDCSSGNGNFYAFAAGRAHLSHWVSLSAQLEANSEIPEWRMPGSLSMRPAARVASELSVHDMLSHIEDGGSDQREGPDA